MNARAWLSGGSLVVAVLAVLALGITVIVAQRALSDASDVVVRGEGDALMGIVVAELTEEGAPPTTAQLEKTLAAHGDQGLRYVAVVDREGKPFAEAGRAELGRITPRPGRSETVGRRVRVANPIFPRRGPRPDMRPPGPGMGGPPGIPLLVIELEPPVIESLRRDLTRISIVGGAAGIVLLAFAFAWSRSAARLDAATRKAAREQRLVALGSMSSVMAHELRNPLASLKGHAQLLVEDLEEPKKRTKAERVVKEAERLEVLTTSLLDFVRDGPIERVSVAPAELIGRALDHLDETRVDVAIEGAPAALRVDEARFSRAIHNIVDNALQATSGKERVDVRVRSDAKAGDVVVEVRDRGAGIAAGQEAQIFEPFVTTRVRGTGLGLAVARRIAEQHEGTLACENHPEGGAVFRLRFPNPSA